MAKIIKLTPELQQEALREFEKYLGECKCQDGGVKFSTTFSSTAGRRATIVMTPTAWEKTLLLLDSFESEVSWHGICVRGDDPDTYVITDILIFPQHVTGASADTDPETYQNWLLNHEIGVRRTIRMHGHSHVNMSTGPSGRDLGYQGEILSQLRSDDYYVFMIWNKKLQFYATIFDMRENIQFEDADISLRLVGTEFDPSAFLKLANTMVEKRVPSYVTPTYRGSSYSSDSFKSLADKRAEEEKKKMQPVVKTVKGKAVPIPPANDVGLDDDDDDELFSMIEDAENYIGIDDDDDCDVPPYSSKESKNFWDWWKKRDAYDYD